MLKQLNPFQRDQWEAAMPLDAPTCAAFEQALDRAYGAYEVKPRTSFITYATAIGA